MANYLLKLRVLYLPFILLLIGFAGSYTLLHWLLLIKYKLFALDQSFINILLPALLSILLTILLFRSRIHLLDFKIKNMAHVYLGFAIVTITLFTATAQYYMVSAVSGVTALQTIDQLRNNVPNRFYTIKQFTVDKSRVQHHLTERSRKRFKRGPRVTEFKLYLVAPILASASDNIAPKRPQAWLGKTYTITLKKREANITEKQQFIYSSLRLFSKEDFRQNSYFEKQLASSELRNYKKALASSNHAINNAIILEPKTKPFAERQRSQFLVMFGASGLAIIGWGLLLIKPNLNKQELCLLLKLNNKTKLAKA